MNRNIIYAFIAAALFGASTPFAKQLLGDIHPVLLGGLLYLGSGMGLGVIRLVRDRAWLPSGIPRSQWPWLLGAIFFGGVLGPVALLLGLSRISGSTASLLLNLESVLTAVLAWVAFKENADRRIVAGMFAIVAGGVVLSWPTAGAAAPDWLGQAAIAAACLCWAIDNNLTRKVSASDALFIASSKGLFAGVVNTLLAVLLGVALPGGIAMLTAMSVGLLGYGVSLVLFVLALRGLGAARTGAYFSTAPFIGAAVSLALLGESATSSFWVASALMAVGVWLHLTEHHEHDHTHEAVTHTHRHMHNDEHHDHGHDFEHNQAQSREHSHEHLHEHVKVTHKHPHFPDVDHRHDH